MTRSAKVLITGGAGFVGSQLGRALSRNGHDVVLLDDMSTGKLDNLVIDGQTFGTLVVADVRSPDITRYFEDVTTVFHFAGIAALPTCQSQPGMCFDVNTSGTANVLEASRLAGVDKVVISSTSAVYERTPSDVHVEDEVLDPDLMYAVSKMAAERICTAYARNYGLSVLICRFFNVYGPHQDFRRTAPPFTSYLGREFANGRPPVLYNDSDVRRDYIHVDDVVRLMIKMMESPSHYSADVFNVASGRAYSVPEIFATMQRVSGKLLEPEFRSPDGFWNAYDVLFKGRYGLSRDRVRDEVYKAAEGDNARAVGEFGWKPEIDLEAGLRSVYEYARSNLT